MSDSPDDQREARRSGDTPASGNQPSASNSVEAKARRTQIIIVVAMAFFMILPFALIALMQWLGR